MTKRLLAYLDERNVYHLSQEFNGDVDEARQLRLQILPDSAKWEDVPQCFIDIQSLEQFREQVKWVEDLYDYSHIPLETSTHMPITDEVWRVKAGDANIIPFEYDGDKMVNEWGEEG